MSEILTYVFAGLAIVISIKNTKRIEEIEKKNLEELDKALKR